MIPKAASVLLDSNLQAASELMELDDRISGIAIDLEARMYDLIARQAPAAGELRTLFVETKLGCGVRAFVELTVNIARAARRLYEAPVTPGVARVVAEMSTETQRLLELSLRSFVESDADLARSIDELDDRVDQLNRDMIASIFDDMAGQPDLTSAVQMALVARYLERIGDHAVNVGNRVVYMVTGAHPPRAGRRSERHRRLNAAGSTAEGDRSPRRRACASAIES